MRNAKFCLLLLLFFCSQLRGGTESLEQEIRDALIRQVVEISTLSLGQWEQTKTRFVPGDRIDVRISNATTGTEVRIVPPPGVETGLRPPIGRMSSYRRVKPQKNYLPLYTVYLLSAKITTASGKGEGEFQLSVSREVSE